MFRFLSLFVILCLLTSAYAGKEPVVWSQIDKIPSTISKNQIFSAHYSFMNNLTFNLPSQLFIKMSSSAPDEFQISDGCSLIKSLKPKQKCIATVTFTAKRSGSVNYSLQMHYGANVVPLPLSGTTVTSQTQSVTATVPLPLPPYTRITLTGTYTFTAAYPVTFQLTNTGTVALSSLTTSPTGGFVINSSASTCTSSLAVGATCQVTGTYTTPTTVPSGTTSIGVTFTYSGGSTTITSSTSTINPGAPTANGAPRIVSIVNNCPFPVSYSIAGAAAPVAGPVSCPSTPCPNGSSCYQGSPPAQGTACFWNAPTPINNSYQLAANTGTSGFIVPVNTNTTGAPNMLWDGGIAAMTGCVAGKSCDTGDCLTSINGQNFGTNGGTTACLPGGSFTPPVTQSEITMARTFANGGSDNYDLEIINGINIPVTFAPTIPTFSSTSSLICTAAGAVTPNNPLFPAGCSWNLVTPTPSYNRVACIPNSSNNSCTNTPCSQGCATGQICGMAFNANASSGSKFFLNVCGTPGGYWSGDQVCGSDPSSTAFACPTQTGQGGLTYTQLFECQGGTLYGTSCYSNNAPNTCCGCVNWNTVISGVPAPNPPVNGIEACVNENSKWTGFVQDTINWMKTACPTSYVYPFDDKTGGMACGTQTSDASQTIITDYTVTFCPNGLHGNITA